MKLLAVTTTVCTSSDSRWLFRYDSQAVQIHCYPVKNTAFIKSAFRYSNPVELKYYRKDMEQ